MVSLTFCSTFAVSLIGLSDRYFTLFQAKFCR